MNFSLPCLLKCLKRQCLILLVPFTASAFGPANITLSAPSSSTTYVDNVSCFLNVADGSAPQQIQVVLTQTGGYNYNSSSPFSITLTLKTNTTGSSSFIIKPTDMGNAANAYTASPSGVSIPEGIYSVYAQYVRAASLGGATVTSTTRTNIYIDVRTLTPVIYLPSASVSRVNSFVVKDTIPEAYLSGSKKITFTSAADANNNRTLNLKDNARKDSFVINTAAIYAPSNIVSISGADTTLPEDTYTATLSYQDRFSHPAATAVKTIIVDRHTQTPVITDPASSSISGQQLAMNLNLPENYAADSVRLVFNKSGTSDTIILSGGCVTGANIFTLNTGNIAASPYVKSSTTNSLSAGTYSINLSYSDSLRNARAEVTASNIVIDNITQSPVITAPANDTTVDGAGNFTINYLLPEKPATNTVQFVFTGLSGSNVVVLNDSVAGARSVSFNPADLTATSGFISATSSLLEDGAYAVTVGYTDSIGNAAAVSNTHNIFIDSKTLTPTLILPGESTTNTGMLNLSFTLPEAALNNRVSIQLVGYDSVAFDLQSGGSGLQTFALDPKNISSSAGVLSASKDTIANGVYTILLSYQDTLGHAVAGAIQEGVTITNPFGDESVFPVNSWNVYAFNTVEGDPQTFSYAGFYNDDSISFSSQRKWDVTASPSDAGGFQGLTVNNDEFKFVAKRKGFPAGRYIISVPSHSGNVLLKINGQEVLNHEGCCDVHDKIKTDSLDENTVVEFSVVAQTGDAFGSVEFTMIRNFSIKASATHAAFCKNDATITVDTATATAPLAYSLDGVNFQAENRFTGLGTGVYTVYVKDATGYADSLPNITVIRDAPMTISPVSFISGACVNTGAIGMRKNGGTSPALFSLDSLNFISTIKFTDLAPGTYNVYAVDARGCTANSYGVVVAKMADVIALPTVTRIASACANDAALTLNKKGGTAPFTYSIDGVNFGTGNIFTGLAGGTYTVSVKDVFGCAGAAGVIVKKTAPIVSTASITKASTCNNDGKITIGSTGGTGPLLYSLDGINYTTNNKLTGLAAGAITAYIRDARGCEASEVFTIGQLAPLAITAKAKSAVCISSSDGSVTVSCSGGAGPMQYQLKRDTILYRAAQTSNLFAAVPAGSYRVIVTDSRGCISQVSITVGVLYQRCPVPLQAETITHAGTVNGNEGPAARLLGNPTYEQFTLVVESAPGKEHRVSVTNILGENLMKANGYGYQQYLFGRDFAPGSYIVQVAEGEKIKTLKAIKIR